MKHALYSFPVCGAVSLSTSPGFTCFRAGLSFFCFGTTAFAAGASVCVSVLLLLIVQVQVITGGHWKVTRSTLTLLSGCGDSDPTLSQSTNNDVPPHRRYALPHSSIHSASRWALCINSESWHSSPYAPHQDRTGVPWAHPLDLVRECASRRRVGAHVACGSS